MSTQALAKRVGRLSSKQTWGATVSQIVGSTLGRTTYQDVPLNYRYPGVEEPEEQTYSPVRTQISTLSNGIRVVSRNTQDPILNIGLYVNAGSRYLTAGTSGIPHFLESMSVEGTSNITPKRFAENLSRTGTTMMVQAFRDSMIYQAETFTKNGDFALESIAELIYNYRPKKYDLKKLKQQYLWRRGDIMRDPSNEIPEFMHLASYQGNTLGLPLHCDDDTIQNINCDTINDFIKLFFQPSRMIVVGVGIGHTELECIAKSTFGDLMTDNNNENKIKNEKANYTGGQLKMKYDFGDDINTHVGLLFETEGWKSKDLMTLCVLNMLMGGGGSFSAGGPGKGMFSRLYSQVLGKHHFVEHISCSHSIFDDSGIFCLYGSCPSEYARQLTGVIIDQALSMIHIPPTKDELNRAKISLASNICFEFENRQIVFEDLGRQVNVFGTHKTPDMWKDEIMAVKTEDITRIAKKIVSTKPTLLGLGRDVSNVPTIQDVEETLKDAQK